MPSIGNIRALATKLIGLVLPEFLTPFPHRFVSHLNPTIEHHFLDIPVAQGKGVVEPDAVADNFARESMPRVHEQEAVNGVGAARLALLNEQLI